MAQSAREQFNVGKKMSDGYKPINIPNVLKVINGPMKNQLEAVKMTEQKVSQSAVGRTYNLSCLHIPVTNLERSVEFYVERLGFHLERGPSRKDQDSNALVNVGGNSPTIFLHETSDVVHLHFKNGIRDFTHCVFEIGTRDIEQFHAQLVKEDVKVGDRFDNPGCGKYFHVYDPDGHATLVCQDWYDRF